jgi:hypothetical protein
VEKWENVSGGRSFLSSGESTEGRKPRSQRFAAGPAAGLRPNLRRQRGNMMSIQRIVILD